MLQVLKNRRAEARDNDRGFTLIELMVVVLIIAILLAIAIPTFLGAQSKSNDRSAQSSVRNALTAAETIFADGSKYSDTEANLVTALTASEANITFGTAASTGPTVVAVKRYSETGALLVTESATDTCYGVYVKKDGADAGTYYGKPAQVSGNCATSAAAPATSGAGAWVKDASTGW